jgi:hypothetical protein
MAFQTGTATDYVDMLDKIATFVAADGAASAVVVVGGTGYSVGDEVTVVGGTATWAATFIVTGETGGIVDTVKVNCSGAYTVTPSNPAATTGAGDNALTLTVAYANHGWTVKRNNLASGTREVILDGPGGGSDHIYVGARTFTADSYYNWELAGFTGYIGANSWANQPGISPGRYDGATPTFYGAYVPLNNSAMTFWLFVNARRIIGVMKCGTTYSSFYLGWYEQFGTSSAWPYPMAVIGCSNIPTRVFTDAGTTGFSGMCDPHPNVGGGVANVNGPAFIRDAGGNWRSFRNASNIGGVANDACIWPGGGVATSGVAEEDLFFLSGYQSTQWIDLTASTPTFVMKQSPGSVSVVWPTIVIEKSPDSVLFGELDGVFWISALADTTNIVSENLAMIDGDTYIVFQNCNRVNHWAFFALLRE